MDELVPQENETIAARRAARLSKKFLENKKPRIFQKRWWADYHVEILLLIFLLAVNIYVALPVWGTKAPEIPYSGPGVPLLAKLLELFGVEIGIAYQYISILFFLLFPLSLYYFVKVVTKRKLPAFFAVLIASIPTYPFAAVRAHAAFFGGDAPHIISLTIMPFSLSTLMVFLQKGTFKHYAWASLLFAVTLLFSAFGYLNLLIFASLVCFSEMMLGNGRLKVVRLMVIVVTSVALTSFWYNPSLVFWMITSPFGYEIRTMVQRLIPISLFSLPVLATFGYLLFDRKPELQTVFLGSFFTIAFAIISLTGGGVFPGSPSRYVVEFGLSVAFLLSVVLGKCIDYVKFIKNPRFTKVSHPYFINSLLLLIVGITLLGIITQRHLIHPNNETVLGIWTGIDRGEIWAKRETFGKVSSAIGYVITGGSIGALLFLGIKTRTANLQNG